MGYKYRNGSTPDHVDSSMSNPTKPNVGLPVSASDSTKKAAPVDTNRVKDDIFNDKVKRNLAKDIIKDPMNSELVQDKDITPGAARKMYSKKVDRLNSSIAAKNDTMDLARKGKIPAKP